MSAPALDALQRPRGSLCIPPPHHHHRQSSPNQQYIAVIFADAAAVKNFRTVIFTVAIFDAIAGGYVCVRRGFLTGNALW